jgi:hypothetical protein
VDTKEGLRRIIKVFSFFAWFWLVLLFLGAVLSIFNEPASSAGFAIGAIGFFGILQGLAWIITGFAGLPKENDGLIRWSDIKAKIPKRKTNGFAAKHSSPLALKGIGGWLMFFMITLVLSALRGIGEFSNLQDQIYLTNPELFTHTEFQSYMQLLQAFTWIAAAIFIATCFSLYKFRNWSTVKSTIIAIWIAGPIIATVASFAMPFMISGATNNISSEDVIPLVGAYFYALIWTAYLLKSKRVKNTYI